MTAGWPTTSPPPRRKLGLGARLGVVLLIALAMGGMYFWRCQISTYHLATVDPGVLYRDGNQSPCQFETAVRKVQPRTVVSLVDENEEADENKPQFQSEKEFLEKKGIRLERIPVRLGGWPTKKDVDRFFEIVNDPQSQPVLVHCAQGVRRTGFMAAAYQMKQMGYDKEQAKQAILRFGHSDRTANDVIRFIDGYDPATGTVPENLMPSNE
jgi:protein tyrosine phosphatase (PTP) superfamily phosphohydrolase (DUF442 family)